MEVKIKRIEESIEDLSNEQKTLTKIALAPPPAPVEASPPGEPSPKGGQDLNSSKRSHDNSRQLSLMQSQIENIKTIELPKVTRGVDQKFEDQRLQSKAQVDKKLRQL